MSAAILGAVIAFLIWMGSGWCGLAGLATFFVAGTAVSGLGWKKKKAFHLEQENNGKRTHLNAMANGGVAAICGALAWWLPEMRTVFMVMVLSSLAVATSDTFSSELGNLYGRRHIDILTFDRGKRGADGVVSPEGTIFGLCGSLLIALVYTLYYPGIGFFVVLAAGIIGNLLDSFLGATLQRKGWLNNHHVNFLSTLFGAILAGIISLQIQRI